MGDEVPTDGRSGPLVVGGAFAATIFVFSAVTWHLGIAPLLPFALFGAGFVAASSLQISARARTGFGVVVAVGGFASFGSMMGTQALTGQESVAQVFHGLGVWFLISYAIGSALGLPLAVELGVRTLAFGFFGLCAGALLAGGLVAFEVFTEVLPSNGFTVSVALAIPAAAGGAMAAWARR